MFFCVLLKQKLTLNSNEVEVFNMLGVASPGVSIFFGNDFGVKKNHNKIKYTSYALISDRTILKHLQFHKFSALHNVTFQRKLFD